jgi:tRNA1(Val) A37 N6-methylase TrmN6
LLHHQLINKVYHLLKANGSFWVLLPASYQQRFIDSAIEHQLFCRSKLLIKNTDDKLPFRVIMEFSQHNIEFPTTEELIIKDKNNNYTSQFTQLLQPYYLNL